MIKGIEGFNEVQAITGDSLILPAGKYICKIKDVKVTKSQNERPLFNLLFDIAQGEYQGYYKKKYEGALTRNPEVKYQGVYKQLMDGNSIGFYKGLLENIKKSNPELKNMDFSQDWDENKLKGKFIGVVMGKKQIKTSEGKIIFITVPKFCTSLDKLEDAKTPEDELLKEESPYSVEKADEDNLPF